MQSNLEHYRDVLEQLRGVLEQLSAAQRSTKQPEIIWGVPESSACAGALRALCSSSSAAQRSLEQQFGVIQRVFCTSEPFGAVYRVWEAAEGAEKAWSSLARWVTAFKGFLEWFRTAECSEGFGREKGKPCMSSP